MKDHIPTTPSSSGISDSMTVKAYFNGISDFKVIIQGKIMTSVFLQTQKILIAGRNVSEHVFFNICFFWKETFPVHSHKAMSTILSVRKIPLD